MVNAADVAEDATPAEEDAAADAAAVRELLAANGLDEEQSCSTATVLEVFQHPGYPRMRGLSRFPALRTLRLLDQRLPAIEGLQEGSGCPQHLEQLWLTENRIASPAGGVLGGCGALRELHLTSNRITSLEGLEALSGSLQVLWVADNYLSSLAGLRCLAALRELNAARNDIACVGNPGVLPPSLTSLNLADNSIASLQDAACSLTRLSALRELCFADPMWGACPVTHLCNYSTYMLAALPQLTALDTLLLAPESKAAAASTCVKKNLYYSMRRQTLRRRCTELERAAAASCDAQLAAWGALRARLGRAARRLKQQQEQEQEQEQPLPGSSSARLTLATLRDLQEAVAGQQAALQRSFAADWQASAAALDAALGRMQLELQSAGNVWLELGRPGVDVWCDDACSSLHPALHQPDGSSTACIVSVERVHNRHLRSEFERHCGGGGGSGGSIRPDAPPASEPHQQQQRLLFSAPLGELMRIVEHGFSTATTYEPTGPAAAAVAADLPVQLAGSIDLLLPVPPPRASGSGGASAAAHVHHVLVCRVGPGGAAMAASTPGGDPSTCGSADASAPSSWWRVADPAAVLPELLVTLRLAGTEAAGSITHHSTDNNTAAAAGMSCAPADAAAAQPSAPAAGSIEAAAALCAQPLAAWLGVDGRQDAASLRAQCEAVLATLPPPLHAALATDDARSSNDDDAGSPTAAAQPACSDVSISHLELTEDGALVLDGRGLTSLRGLEAAGPRLLDASLRRNRISTLDSLSGLAACSRLQRLTLADNLLTSLASLPPLASLQALDVAANSIDSLAPLSGCLALTQLVAHHNRLTSLAPLLQLTRLVELYAAANLLADMQEAERLAALPHLAVLELTGNPLASAPAAAAPPDAAAATPAPCAVEGQLL